MKIKFHGAAREVTGSRHLLTVNGKKILLDCGLYQGSRKLAFERNNNFGFEPSEIDAVVLSHAHIDHSGALPALVKKGFNGPIYATHATRDLCTNMLLDSAYIQEREFEYLQRKKKKPQEPLYNSEDACQTLRQFMGMAYDTPFQIVPGVVASFRDAGHVLGSAISTFVIDDEDDGKQKLLTFTGDLGRKGLPLLRDPVQVERSDILISESTYGNRFHAALSEISEKLEEIVNEACEKGGKIIIPAFALERTQEIVYHLNLLFEQKKIPDIPIYVDSPLAVNLTEVFTRHPESFDKETYKVFLNNQKDPFGLGRITYITDVQDSKALNEKHGPMIIISASGMMEFGRVVHHLKNNIDDPRNQILIVGYMAANTLGRKIQDGEKVVNIFGDPYHVRAKITKMDAFSAHADRSDLLDYVSHIKGLQKIFLVHGEEEGAETFSKILMEEGHKDVIVPNMEEEFEI